jgi:hypothetical protein
LLGRRERSFRSTGCSFSSRPRRGIARSSRTPRPGYGSRGFEGLADEFVLDPHPFTVDAVRSGRFGDAIFVVGADEGAAFPTWKDPDEVLRWVRVAVGTRSGYPPPDLERYGDRVLAFELPSPPVSSTEVRKRLARGEPVDGLVPHAVAAAIDETGLYRGYTDREPERT